MGRKRTSARLPKAAPTLRSLRPYLTHRRVSLRPMSVPAEISDKEMLTRLAACDLSAAERVHERLMAAEAASEVAELGRTYQRIARALRQTLALQARLKREQAQAAKDVRLRRPAASPWRRRVREVRDAVLRVIWDEAEGQKRPRTTEDALEPAGFPWKASATASAARPSTITSRASASASTCRRKAPKAGATRLVHVTTTARPTRRASASVPRDGAEAGLQHQVPRRTQRTTKGPGAARRLRPAGAPSCLRVQPLSF